MRSVIKTLKALSDRNRLRIILALDACGELCACQITEFLGIKGATVSRHLSILSSAGLVNSRKDGRWMYFSLKDIERRLCALLKNILLEAKKSREYLADIGKLKKITACPPEQICRKQRGV